VNKSQFFKQLGGHLSKMPKTEKDDIFRDFEEFFADAERDGEEEQAVCARLGDPKKIAREYNMQKAIEEANQQKTFSSMGKAVLASTGLGAANFFYAICVVAVGYIVIAALYITAVGIGLGAVAALVGAIVLAGMIGAYAFWFFLFGSIGLLALSVLGFIGIMQLSGLFRRANMAFLNMTRKGMRKGTNNEQ
jgi:uncharacterized membrane protein